MLVASDAESNGQRKKKQQSSETLKISPRQYQCKQGDQGYRGRGGQHLIASKPRSDFRHQDQVPEDGRGMR
jgi:hypothetical protein